MSQPAYTRPRWRWTPAGIIFAVWISLGILAIGYYFGVPLLRGVLTPPDSGPPLLFANTGAQRGTAAVAMAGGYQLDWTAHPLQPWPLPAWHFGISVHAPDGVSNYHLLLDKSSLPATGWQQGTARVTVPAGTYVLDVAAGDPFAWTVKLTPLP